MLYQKFRPHSSSNPLSLRLRPRFRAVCQVLKSLFLFPRTGALLTAVLVNLTLLAGDVPFSTEYTYAPPLDEISGIAVSRKNTDVLWIHNDSGDQNRIYAINSQGNYLGAYYIDDVSSRDWEDIAVGPGPIDSEHYIYIGDIGDNQAEYDFKYIYRVREPYVDFNQSPLVSTISDVEVIKFQYPDGKRDAETLMVDPLTKDIYIVSKRESNVRVYRAPYPQATNSTITLEHVATLNLDGQTVGGDISPSGLGILLKTYSSIYYWCRMSGQKLWQTFKNKPVTVPYTIEPQGEAVGWMSNGLGYYTISEEPDGNPAHLYFYPIMILK
ncbi:lipoprotein [Candidatus Thiomargarita nelsonii]|uniref:Lipoprotein n=1 Tax=Candidatus Thiomargarita nelsonii TaxID=1003181 RepID=A0A176S7W4_9GAMM|nr:lipoprotein [Candidatus Thiomargarita nelsonii]